MSETPDQEIQTLQSIFWSKRDPDGLAFAPLAQAHLRRGEIREALDLLTDGTSRHPDYATGHVIATRLYFDQGMHAEAEFAARRVLELDPENIVGLSILVAVLRGRGDHDADEVLARLIDVDPESEEARWATASVVAEGGEEDGGDFFGDPWDPGAGTDDLAAVEEDEDVEDDVLAALTLRDDLASSPDDVIMDLDALAPDESVTELDALAPDSVMDLGALAPDVVMDLDALAPDDTILDLGALAPDRATVDPEGLRPDPTSDPDPVDLAELAPDPNTMDLDALAPDTPDEDDRDADPVDDDSELDAMDLGALAPDAAPDDDDAMDLAALAPDVQDTSGADEPDADAMDLAALAPDDPVEPDPRHDGDGDEDMDAMELSALAPDDIDGNDADTEAMDLAALAPDVEDPDGADADAMDLAALAPDVEDPDDGDAEAMDLDALAPDANTRGDDGTRTSEPVRTRTLAELYVKQGFLDQAVSVYRQLLVTEPGAEDVRSRLAELEGGVTTPVRTATSVPHPRKVRLPLEEEVETLARDLAESGDSGHDVDTPFAWMDEADTTPDDSPGIRDYFDALLSRDPRDS